MVSTMLLFILCCMVSTCTSKPLMTSRSKNEMFIPNSSWSCTSKNEQVAVCSLFPFFLSLKWGEKVLQKILVLPTRFKSFQWNAFIGLLYWTPPPLVLITGSFFLLPPPFCLHSLPRPEIRRLIQETVLSSTRSDLEKLHLLGRGLSC